MDGVMLRTGERITSDLVEERRNSGRREFGEGVPNLHWAVLNLKENRLSKAEIKEQVGFGMEKLPKNIVGEIFAFVASSSLVSVIRSHFLIQTQFTCPSLLSWTVFFECEKR